MNVEVDVGVFVAVDVAVFVGLEDAVAVAVRVGVLMRVDVRVAVGGSVVKLAVAAGTFGVGGVASSKVGVTHCEAEGRVSVLATGCVMDGETVGRASVPTAGRVTD